MPCIKYESRPWSKWFTNPPAGNAVRWFPYQGIELTPELSAEIDRWFASDEAHGLFRCRPEMNPDTEVDPTFGVRMASPKEMGWIFYFSDPDTAFAFRLRFT